MLSFESERTQQIKSWPLRAGNTYELKHVSATADTRYCVSILEEAGGGARRRALALVCRSGGLWQGEHFGSIVTGRADASYSVIVWRARESDPAASVLVTLDIEKRREPR